MNKEKIYIGIDVGKKGGLVALKGSENKGKWAIPTIGNDIDGAALSNILLSLKDDYDAVVLIEDVHSVFGASAKANFTFGFVCGLIEGVVIAAKMKFVKVQPKVWQKEIWTTPDIEYEVGGKEGKRKKVNTKLTSLKSAMRLFPNFDFRATERSKVAHDGIVDALLIAEYGRRKNF